MCHVGCLDVDPHPNAPGLFLGSGVTDGLCFNPMVQTDTDLDMLSDFCEKNLAAAFAPQLAYSASDDTGREPKWVAAPTALDEARVRILYLISYYKDNGPEIEPYPCPSRMPYQFWEDPCTAHDGDSETIALDVSYDSETQHWVLRNASYSAHTGYNFYGALPDGHPLALEYVGNHPGGAPRAYVAYSKHANYATEAECDAGAAGFEVCMPDTFERLAAGANSNLGSYAKHTASQDCMLASNPIYRATGRTECYWTTKRFSGWIGGQPDASAYSERLREFGFKPSD